MITEKWINEIETPCIVADMSVIRRNIENMQAAADKNNCALRPHIKTHKNVEIAKLQVAAGACGITCAKISEAEVMADGGLKDIFVAYPLIGENKIKRTLRLCKKVERLILAVDSLEGAEALSKAAAAENISIEVRLEVDTGLRRTGVIREDVAVFAEKINAMPSLKLTGIYTFKSLIYENKPTTDASLAGAEEGRLMAGIAREIKSRGINITDISAGSTPTAVSAAETGLVTEIRPGTYVFHDYMTYKEGVCQSLSDIAARIYSTVVSTPEPDYAVIDGGTKTFPTDQQLNSAPYYYPGYAVIEDYDYLALSRMNEEHGIVTLRNTSSTGLSVGQILKLIPIHICPAINLQNHIYLLENNTLRKVKVDARGMLV